MTFWKEVDAIKDELVAAHIRYEEATAEAQRTDSTTALAGHILHSEMDDIINDLCNLLGKEAFAKPEQQPPTTFISVRAAQA